MDEIKEKKHLIKEIENCLDEIKYIRENFVFESELEFNDIKELENAISKSWHLYYKLYQKISTKN